MKQHSFYNIIRCIVLLLAVSATITAQPSFRTAELHRLATATGIDLTSVSNGYSHPTAGDSKLTVHVAGHVIDHVGLHLFPDDIRQLDASPVYDFLERYFLQLRFPPTLKSAQLMTRDDEFRFVKGGLATIGTILPTDAFTYRYDRQYYVASWHRDGQPLLVVRFPIEYELISGENKIEAENNLLADIRATVYKPAAHDIDSLRDDHYVISGFSNRLYLHGHQLVCSIIHPAETAANLMLSQQATGQYQLRLTQVSYGFKWKTFDVPLRQWIAFCRKTGCQLYFGVDHISEVGDVEAVVLAVNKAENYNHVLSVTIPLQAIEQHEGLMEARLYPFVPTHNVSTLFASYRKSNPKSYVIP